MELSPVQTVKSYKINASAKLVIRYDPDYEMYYLYIAIKRTGEKNYSWIYQYNHKEKEVILEKYNNIIKRSLI